MYIDSHCHITSLDVLKQDEVLNSPAKIACIDSSIDLRSSRQSVLLSQQHPFVYTSLGFHPFSAKQFANNTIAEYQELLDNDTSKRIVAVGEIGLDCKADFFDEQVVVLRQFIQLAAKNDLPIFIHNRMEGGRIFEILNEFYRSYDKIIFHCFSYDVFFLEKILARNGYVSFSLNVLRNSKKLTESLKNCPIENILLETDSPYMKIGSDFSTPLDIVKVYDFVSEKKNIEIELFKKAIFQNAKKVLKIQETAA